MSFLINSTKHFIYLPIAAKTPLAALTSDLLTRSIEEIRLNAVGCPNSCLVANLVDFDEQNRKAFTEGIKRLLSELAADLKMASPYSFPFPCVLGIMEEGTIRGCYGTIAFAKVERGLLCSFAMQPIEASRKFEKADGDALISELRNVMETRNFLDKMNAEWGCQTMRGEESNLASVPDSSLEETILEIFSAHIRNERAWAPHAIHHEWRIDYLLENGYPLNISEGVWLHRLLINPDSGAENCLGAYRNGNSTPDVVV